MARARSGAPRRRVRAGRSSRRHSLGGVLECLHLDGPTSRTQLTELTGLNRSTIAELVHELGDLGLVDERAAQQVTGPGRPSPVVHPRPLAAVVLAVELAVASVSLATVGLGGRVLARCRLARTEDDPAALVNEIASAAAPLLAALPDPARVVGTGVAVVGVARSQDGVVELAPNLGWRGVPLGAMLDAALGLPGWLLVGNDADLGAVAEQRRGVGRGVEHLLYVSGEVGLGCGVISSGIPLRGTHGFAGEAGHMLVNPDGRPCRCGATGCWETEAGSARLLARAGLATGSASIDELEVRAAAGEEAACAALCEVGRWLGIGIGDLVNLFDPQLVVLGSIYGRLFGWLEPSLREGVGLRSMTAVGGAVEVVRSGLVGDAALLGAAEQVFDRVLADPVAAVRPRPAPRTARGVTP